MTSARRAAPGLRGTYPAPITAGIILLASKVPFLILGLATGETWYTVTSSAWLATGVALIVVESIVAARSRPTEAAGYSRRARPAHGARALLLPTTLRDGRHVAPGLVLAGRW